MDNTLYSPLNIYGEERMTTIGNNRYAVLDQFDNSLDSSRSYSLLRNMRDNQVYINTAKGNFLVENPKLLKELRTGKVPINSNLLNKLTPNKIYMGEDGKYTQIFNRTGTVIDDVLRWGFGYGKTKSDED